MNGKRLAVTLVMAAGTTASAQSPPPMVTKRIDDGTAYHRSEMALRVSKTTFDVVAVWHQKDSDNSGWNNVHCNSSIDGINFGTLSDPVPLPAPIPLPSEWGIHGADPMVTFTPDGTAYLGYVGLNPCRIFQQGVCYGEFDRFWIARKETGEMGADEAVATSVSVGVLDKGTLVADPYFGGSATLGLLFSHRNFSQPGNEWRMNSMIEPPQSTYLPLGTEHELGNRGGSNSALILSINNEARWVVGYQGPGEAGSPRPRTAWSDDGGETWEESPDLTKYTKRCPSPCTTPETEDILWLTSGLIPSGGPLITNFPNIALDPNNHTVVYKVFMGRPQSDSTNMELFIARSTDGGENFTGPALDRGEYVLRLHEEYDLGDPADSIQFLPSITVDDWGGVHVLYYVANFDEEEEVWMYKVKLASIPSFSIRPHPTTIDTIDITPDAFDLEHSSVAFEGVFRFIGHYMNTLDSRGCQLYCGYIARPNSNPVGVYVAMVLNENANCEPDPECSQLRWIDHRTHRQHRRLPVLHGAFRRRRYLGQL